MRRWLVLLLSLLLLAGCAPALDARYTEANVLEVAKTFLSDLNEREYDDCADRFSDLMAAQFDAALLRDAMEQTLDNAGAFVAYKKESTNSQMLDGVPYAVAVLFATYENASIRYTVVLDPDYAVAGFYFR